MKQVLLFALGLLGGQSLYSQVLRPVKPTPAGTTVGACCGFRAYNSTDLPITVDFAKENTLVFDKELFDDANACNGAAYKAPADGVYQFVVQLGLRAQNPGTEMSQVLLKVKTSRHTSSKLINIPPGYDNVISGETGVIFRLKSGEEVSVTLTGMGSATATTTGNLSYFSGTKLY